MAYILRVIKILKATSGGSRKLEKVIDVTKDLILYNKFLRKNLDLCWLIRTLKTTLILIAGSSSNSKLIKPKDGRIKLGLKDLKNKSKENSVIKTKSVLFTIQILKYKYKTHYFTHKAKTK